MADRVQIDVDVNDASLKQAGQDVEKFGNQAKTAGDHAEGAGKKAGIFSSALGDISKMAVSFASAQVLTGAFQKVTGMISGSLDAASDLNESLSKMKTVFGDSSGSIDEWSRKTASSLGISRQSALEATGTFGNLFTAMGMAKAPAADMSMNLVQLAADLASFNNMDPTEVLVKLRAGLVGEAEPMRTLGVNINATTVEAKGLSMGLETVGGKLTDASLITARYTLIMEQSKTAQGDFARTADGAANQSRILNAEMANLAATAGSVLLPAKIALQKAVIGLIQSLGTMGSTLKPVLGMMADHAGTLQLAAGLIALGAAFKGITTVMPMVVEGFKAFQAGALSAAKAIPLMATGILAVVVAADLAAQKFTGHGLIEWVFGDPIKADATKRAIEGVNRTLSDFGTNAAKVEYLKTQLAGMTEVIFKFSQSDVFENSMFKNANNIDKFAIAADGAKPRLEALAKAMVDAKAGPLDLWEAYQKLPPELQKTFDKLTGMSAALADGKFVMAEAAKATDSWATKLGFAKDSTGALHDKTSIAVTKTQLFVDAMNDAEDAAAKEGKAFSGVADAIKDLISAYVDLDPEVLAAKASSAMLTLEYDKIIAKGDLATASEKARAETIEKQLLPALQTTIKLHEDLSPAISNQIAAIGQLIGDGGKGITGLSKALQSSKMPGDELAQTLDDIRLALSQQDASKAVGEFKKLYDSVEIGLKPEFARAVGPALIEKIRAGVADPAEQEKLLSVVREMMGVKVPNAITMSGAEARLAAKQVGMDMGAGVDEGITFSLGALSTKVFTSISNLVRAMQNAARTGSKSKETYEKVGIPLAQGVGEGFGDEIARAGVNMSGWLVGLIRDLKATAAAGAADIKNTMVPDYVGTIDPNTGKRTFPSGLGFVSSFPGGNPADAFMKRDDVSGTWYDSRMYGPRDEDKPHWDSNGKMYFNGSDPFMNDFNAYQAAIMKQGANSGGGVTINGNITINTTDPDSGKAALDNTMYYAKAAAMAKGLA